MARIDSLVHHLFEFGADALGVGAGHQVVLMSGGERRPITAAPLKAEQVLSLLGEIIPPDAKDKLTGGMNVEFHYSSPAGRVKIEAMLADTGPRMVVSRATDSKPAAPAAPAPDVEGFEMAKTGEVRLSEPEMAALKARVDQARGAQPQPAGAPPVGVSMPAPPPATSSAPAAPSMGSSHGEDALDLRLDIPLPQAGQPCALDPYLTGLVQKGGSDLYICTDKPPLIRRDGDLVVLGDATPLTVEQTTRLLFSIAPEDVRRAWLHDRDVDFAYEIPGVARFRANVFEDRRGIAGIFRQIPSKVLSAEDLNLPQSILGLCTMPKGLVVVTGPTGSGKSTTLAAMIDYINRTQPKHIITIEDPIEFVHEDKRCVINQRQVGTHTKSFKRALKSALREDPDIVLVGEMRDLETIEIAIETAETGHLVFGTLHTNTAASTVDRIIDQFPSDRQAQIRTMLSESLKGVVSQALVKRKGGGRAAALEILIVTPSVANIIREGKTFQLPSIMQTGKSVGMVTMNDAFLHLVKSGTCTAEEAISKSISKTELKAVLQRNQIKVD